MKALHKYTIAIVVVSCFSFCLFSCASLVEEKNLSSNTTDLPTNSNMISSDGNLIYHLQSQNEQARQISQATKFAPFLKLNEQNKRIVTRISNKVYKISAWPQAGFNYDYYLYIPDNFSSNYLLAISISSGGEKNMGPEYYSNWARNVVIRGNWETKIADKIKAPLLYPAFERPNTPAAQYLSRDSMLLSGERISRLDLQMISMIDDARSFFTSEFRVELNEKVFLSGFSMSAEFAMRFTLMHPERVQAAAYGGTSFMHILPYSRDKKLGEDLIYPIGVSDIVRISGNNFDREAYLKVPRFLSMGLLDVEDITRYGGLYPSSMQSWIDSRLGSLEKRWDTVTKLLQELGNFEYKLYRDRGHNFDIVDYTDFLNRYNSLR